jgi:vancomycin permeability regulator SanA
LKKLTLRIFIVACTLAAAVILFLAISNLIILLSTKNQVLTLADLSEIEAYDGSFDVIIVLGAAVREDGSPSAMLQDRLEVGAELYFAGFSDKILMSGDHMSKDYDEVSNMKKYAIEAGIDSQCIYLDHAGLSTYDSIWRLSNIYGAKKVLIVTQSYHLPRALYLAKAFGMEALGASADLRPYHNQIFRDVREIVARGKDVLFTMIKPNASHVGDPISLDRDGDITNENPFWKEG